MQDTRSIHTQKRIVFLYSSNKQTKNEIKKTIPFTISSKGIKYLEKNLTEEQQNLHSENYKTLLKEIKDLNKWKQSYSWNGKFIKMKILP